MVKKIKDIDKIARDYANKEYPPMFEMPDDNWKQRAGFVKGFKAGVEWRKSLVWHKSDEKPDEHKLILETDGKGAFCLHATNYMPLDENTRWAYVEDLTQL